jgi:hypothetical protein
MRRVYNDGRRKGAGYKGDAGDCVARAIAIPRGLPNKQVYQRLAAGKSLTAGHAISVKRK